MKKISNIKLCLSILFSASLFVSCENDDFTGDSTLEVAENVVGTISFDGSLTANQTVNEVDENSYQYTITLDKPQSVDIHVRVTQTGGTADSDDYEMDEIVVIPAYSSSAVGNIKILSDCTIESVETLDLQIGTISTSNANTASKTVSFTINPYLSTDLELDFNFNKDFSITGNSFTLCTFFGYPTAVPSNGGVDLDFLILDENLNDTGIADAQTGNCTESLTITPDLLSDGIYHVYYFIYNDNDLSTTFHDPFHIPLSVDYSRCGGIDPATYTVPEEITPLTTDGENSIGYVVSVVINNGLYTLQNQANEIIASGRMSNFKKNALVSKLANRRK